MQLATRERPAEGARESTRPIRALNRGLEVLTELNRLERAAINTLASAVGLPRTTTYRILETMRLAGYVERDPQDDCYRPTIMVRALSDGFDDEAMVAYIAKPHLAALCAQIVWPAAIATPVGASMVIRETTDHQSPLALEQYGAGSRVPMLASAAGRAYLAFCSAAQRDALLELLARSSLPEDRLARSRTEVERILNETRAQGFGMAQRARRVSEETSLAVPIQREGSHPRHRFGPLRRHSRPVANRDRAVFTEDAGCCPQDRARIRSRNGVALRR